MGYAKVFVGVLFLFVTLATTSAIKCTTTTNSTCRSLIDYVPVNNTVLSAVQSLFQIKRFHDLLGANDFSTSTLPNQTLPANQRIRIPFTCRCVNGTGVSDRAPVYTVIKDDGLYHIAFDIFSNLVTYQEIAKVNGIPNPDKIEVGQRLWIPLPCSCDEVEGAKVVHYGHVVESGSSVDQIATVYGTTPAILLNLNGMANASELKAGQVFDVPLKACNSSVNSSSLDYPLLVANGTYVYTANDCVNCKCSSENNYILQCGTSGLKPSKTWSTCPAAQCNGTSSLYLLGNVTTASTTCNQTTCAYSGFTNKSIFTTLATESTCPAGLRWSFHFFSIQLIFLCFHLSQ
ncbi:hypothetical protein ACB092_07G199400 [Castanea dentata]